MVPPLCGRGAQAHDPLHWTGREQTWNYQCAECHSTNLHKNYDIGQNRYATTWSEMMVSCEACHGPGSAHVAWAQARPVGTPRALAGTTVLTMPLGRGDGSWVMQDSHRGIAQWSGPARSTAELDVCARCHARRRPIVAPYHTASLPRCPHASLSDAALYQSDGQILGEVYEYGSFIQSRMFRAGVTCSDCHDPHGLGLRAPGNGVCAQCHMPAKFDTPAHHHHNVNSDAARCVSCHMPARTYMVVDPRRDHDLRIPRPDLSHRHACTECHQDQPPAWAAAQVVRWYGASSPVRQPHFAAALDAGRRGLLSAEKALAALATDASQPGIARATALALLPEYLSAASLPPVEAALGDADPGCEQQPWLSSRHSCQPSAYGLPPPASAMPCGPCAWQQPTRSPACRRRRSPVQQADFERALAELVAAETVNADQPEAHLNLANLYVRLGRTAEAKSELQSALVLDPRFVPALVNLADLFRAQGRDADSARVLEQALQVAPDSAEALHALGLLECGRVSVQRRWTSCAGRRRGSRSPRALRTFMRSLSMGRVNRPGRSRCLRKHTASGRPTGCPECTGDFSPRTQRFQGCAPLCGTAGHTGARGPRGAGYGGVASSPGRGSVTPLMDRRDAPVCQAYAD